ncbi:MAG TPA: flagellar assembly protein A [Aromatoleum sp.]|uniref:flagellar assembly protein A n=1 Tax=Aromatoleum sp. TaxID=2307007 RepID=UPI002B494B09|nr:flagellar assembly protein A [Aromatoleum sp.]HJV27938.1 flagellar assembly protein A [Aromatoleum sp.]
MADAAAGVDGNAPEPLPRFIVRDETGLSVDLNYLSASAEFNQWVDRMFIRGAYFRGTDYPAFLRLAFDFEPGMVIDEIRAREAAGGNARVRFAAGISFIVGQRVSLYRGVKVSGGRAEYLFEPVSLEYTVEQPVAGAGGDEEGGVARTESVVVSQKTKLDFDEFVAQMWLKGVKFGVDEAEVRKAIADDYVGRLKIAEAIAPTAGSDAGVQEVSDVLHRDDAPGSLPDGRINLARFRNRFPQIRAGARLLRKTPLVLGALGRELNGRPVAPQVPKDFDFATLSGPGTRVDRDEQGECLVAAIDGFLDIDNDSGKISVSEKVVNRAGVSLRTTGDISLMGDEYEEHGEIQERRVVEGLNITTYADVFGKIVSRGGRVVLKQNLSGGSIVDPGGEVRVEGRVSGATIFAPGGEVTVGVAESSLIVARRVVGERAVGCDILADEVQMAVVEASVLASPSLAIEAVRPRGQAETLISVLLPADDAQRALLAQARTQLEALDQADAAARQLLESARTQPGVANYMAVAGKLRRKEISLTAEQQAAFIKLRDKVAPVLKALARLTEEGKARATQREALQSAMAAVEEERRKLREAVSCSIGDISGDVIVRARPQAADAKPVAQMTPAEIKSFLRAAPSGSQKLLVAAKGSLQWRLADEAATPA